MKKKIVLAIVAALVGLVGFAGNASAYEDVSVCIVAGQHTATKEFCAGSLYRKYPELRKNCNSEYQEYGCKNQLTGNKKKYFRCGDGFGGDCNGQINTYISSLLGVFNSNKSGVSSCYGVSGSSYNDCIIANSKFHFASDEALEKFKKSKNGDGTDGSENGGGNNGDGNNGGGGNGGGNNGGGNSTPTTTPGQMTPMEQGECTSLLPDSWCNGKNGSGILDTIKLVISILTGAVVVAGSVGIIVCGVLWMTARDNEAQIAKAKKRMLELVIGIVAFVLFSTLANLIIPKSSDTIESDLNSSVIIEEEDIA